MDEKMSSGMEPLNEDLTKEPWYTEDMGKINEWAQLTMKRYELLERKRISDEEDAKAAPGIREVTEDVRRWDKEKFGALYPVYAQIKKMQKAPFYDDDDDDETEDIFTYKLGIVDAALEDFQGEEWHTADFQRIEMWLKYMAVKRVRRELNEPIGPKLTPEEVKERVYAHAIKKYRKKWKILFPLYSFIQRKRRKFPFDEV